MKNQINFMRYVAYCFTVALVASVGVSCKKAADVLAADQVAGNWKLSALLVKEGTTPEEDVLPFLSAFAGSCFTDLVFSFGANGTLTSNNPVSCKSINNDLANEGVVTNGKWALNGNKMIFTDNSNVKEEYDYSLSGGIMSLSQSETDATTKVVTKTTLKFKRS